MSPFQAWMFVLIILTQKTNAVLPASGMPAFFVLRIEQADGIAGGLDAEGQRRLAHQADAVVVADFDLGLRVGHGDGRLDVGLMPVLHVRSHSRGWTSAQVHSAGLALGAELREVLVDEEVAIGEVGEAAVGHCHADAVAGRSW